MASRRLESAEDGTAIGNWGFRTGKSWFFSRSFRSFARTSVYSRAWRAGNFSSRRKITRALFLGSPRTEVRARRSAQQDRLVVCSKTIGPSLHPARQQLPESPSFGRFGRGNAFGQRAAIRAHSSVEHRFVHSGTEQLGPGEIGLAEIGPGQIGPT